MGDRILSSNIQKGLLKNWNKDRGFGFIKPEQGGRDVFIHISALKKMSRLPKEGDTIYFEIQRDRKGKTRAVNARIEGVKPISTNKIIQKPAQKVVKRSRLFQLIVIVILIIIIGLLFKMVTNSSNVEKIPSSVPNVSDVSESKPVFRQSDTTVDDVQHY